METRTLLSATANSGLEGIDDAPAVLPALFASSDPLVNSEITFPGFCVLQGEQAKVEEQITGLLAAGKSIDDLEDFDPVPMPERFLDGLVEAFGAETVVNALGEDVLRELFGDAVDSVFHRTYDDKPRPMLVQSSDLIDMDGFRSSYSGIDGSGYAVVVIDTGFDLDHEAFGTATGGVADRIVYQYDFAEDDDNATYYSSAYGGWDHGTHVAGIVASEDGTYTGMAPGVDLITLKVSEDDGNMEWSYIEEALQWAVDNVWEYQIVAVNMSLGGGNFTSPYSYLLSDELADLADLGVIVASAAGNSYGPSYPYNSLGVAYPAADANSLAVGAVYDANVGAKGPYPSGAEAYTTAADRVAPYSQRHATMLDALAPGSEITSAIPGDEYAWAEGTSMSAPHIAGIAALVQQLAEQELGRRVTQDEFLQLLDDTGDDVVDGDDEDDNVTNTNDTYQRIDMLALADELTSLTGVYDYDAGAPNGSADTFNVDRVGSNLVIKVNGVTQGTLVAANVKQITLNGSTDADTFTITDLGDFDGDVVINAEEVGTTYDTVYLDDTSGDDFLMAEEDYVVFSMEDAYVVTVNDAFYVHNYARNGGNDRAFMGGNDSYNKIKTYDSDSNVARIWQNGIYHRAKFFDSVVIDGRGGDDIAYVYDTPKTDAYTGDKFGGRQIASGSGDLTDYTYEDFETVWVYAGSSADTATLNDSPGDDEVRFRPSKTEMYNRTGGDDYTITLRYFDYVLANSTNGGTDYAKMHDEDATPAPLDTTDLITAVMESSNVRAKFYRDSPGAADLVYESLGFELTKGYSAYGPDEKDTDGVNPSLLAWSGTWIEI